MYFYSCRKRSVETPRTMDSNAKSYHPRHLNSRCDSFSFRGLFKEEGFSVPAYLPSALLSALVKRHWISIRVCRPAEMLWIWIQGLQEQKYQEKRRVPSPRRVFEGTSQGAAALRGTQPSIMDEMYFTPSLPLWTRTLWCVSSLTAVGFFIFLTYFAHLRVIRSSAGFVEHTTPISTHRKSTKN